jgi:hypothetical protein
MVSRDLVIITCGKQKLKTDKPVTLDKLYTNKVAKAKLKLARLLTKDPFIYVLSGKLGIVPISHKSAYYDSKDKLPSKELVDKQLIEMTGLFFDCDKIYYIGHKRGFEYLMGLRIDLFYSRLINYIPNAIGIGDFESKMYAKIRQLTNNTLLKYF